MKKSDSCIILCIQLGRKNLTSCKKVVNLADFFHLVESRDWDTSQRIVNVVIGLVRKCLVSLLAI